jgi:flagellar protein FlaG
MTLSSPVQGIGPTMPLARSAANAAAPVVDGRNATPQQPAASPPPPAPGAAAVQAAAAELDAFMRSSGRTIEFAVDASSGLMVVNVRDSNTGQSIRQIPSDEVIRIARALRSNRSSNHLLLEMRV